jgi:hypothetical protein
MSWRVPRRIPVAPTALLVVCGLVAACDSAPLNPNNVGWVTTLVDSTPPALQQARTFAVPDTIVALNGGTFNHAQDKVIASEVRGQFLAHGWVERADTTGPKPDVVVGMGTNTRTEVGISYADWFPSYGWIPYWGTPADPSWVWGAPAGAIAYVYEVGTLVITMVDLRAPRETTKRVPVLWVAAVNGVLGDSPVLPRVLTGIDQAFAQSPYLRIP